MMMPWKGVLVAVACEILGVVSGVVSGRGERGVLGCFLGIWVLVVVSGSPFSIVSVGVSMGRKLQGFSVPRVACVEVLGDFRV